MKHPPLLASTLIGPALIAATISLALAADEPSMLDKLKAGAAQTMEKIGAGTGSAVNAIGQTVDKAAQRANATVEQTQYDLSDGATPAETRQKLDRMAEQTLAQLFEKEPDAKPLYDASVGYAVFNTRQVQMMVAAGYGRGVAVNRETQQRTYMKMGTGGVGVGFGIGGFDVKLVILFETDFQFQKFISQGLDATAEAGTMTGERADKLSLSFDNNGRAVFALTGEGWKVSAKLTGTKYWPDQGLNQDQQQDQDPVVTPSGSTPQATAEPRATVD
jgi:lipid-binding SYLF domain-containing protein